DERHGFATFGERIGNGNERNVNGSSPHRDDGGASQRSEVHSLRGAAASDLEKDFQGLGKIATALEPECSASRAGFGRESVRTTQGDQRQIIIYNRNGRSAGAGVTWIRKNIKHHCLTPFHERIVDRDNRDGGKFLRRRNRNSARQS